MSTIDLTTMSEFAKIPLLRRIIELLEEQEDNLSKRSIASMIGVNRETVRLLFKEKRPVTLDVLEKIAKGLSITVDRIRQLDSIKREKELNKVLTGNKRTRVMLMRALDLATELVELSLGVTERGYALNNLGRVLYVQGEYNKAHDIWLSALDFAKSIQREHNDSQLLHIVTANLMLTYTIRKEYSNIESIFHIVEQAFPDHPKAMGQCFYTKMKMEEERGNLELAREYSYNSLEHFSKTDDDKQIGKAFFNVAYYEFLLGSFKKSLNLLSTSIEYLRDFDDLLIRCVKDYVKCLMKLRDHETAIRVVEEYSELAREYPEYRAKLRIMYAVAKDDPSIADYVMKDTSLSVNTRYIASKCLLEYHYSKGDSDSAMRYYEMVRIFSSTKSGYLDEEGL
ncbi:helix-turn-helix domain-containing protein [Tumebacillus permanentifrigoris]|uniref:Helix-turn-helix protein n=1 Tax=Tumebacillus permanentifrigoris TaxID=378543 RepID=A0A316DCT2_9BACL|nr:helix-turn-helix transcriptional regulator [Tumebacillus permanentifrigoris]PWK15765.1 helix-turn-helix protein [Tumebacillus permanentifrigoris]